MRLTRHTDYALRMLVYINLREGALSTIREISDAYAISRNHLMKVAHQLQKQGYLETVRGRAGGLVLARPGSDIRLGRLVMGLEPDMALAECMGPENQCVISADCRLKDALRKAKLAFIEALDGYTLADLTVPGEHRAVLRQHLQIVNC